jgi:hypothetical protein
MTVTPGSLSTGETLTVSNPTGGPLPVGLSCTIADAENTNQRRQVVEIDTSGLVELDLKDRYGALQVEACDESTCLESVTFAVEVTNASPNATDVTELNLRFDGVTSDMLQGATPSLLPRGSATFTDEREVDVCTSATQGAVVTGSGLVSDLPDDVDGGACLAAVTLDIELEPRCFLGTTLTCEGADIGGGEFDNIPCNEIPGEMQPQCFC